MKIAIDKIEILRYPEMKITATYTTEPFWWFTPPKSWTRTWRGSSTVWHDAETGERCSYERPLSDAWTVACWRTEDAKRTPDRIR